MLCPRCNSENEAGEKFCRHCGAPLVDTELFMSERERKIRKKEIKRLEKQKEKEERLKNNPKGIIPKRTYTLNENAYKRNYTSMAISLAKSIAILVVILILVYFIGNYVLKIIAEKTDHYSVSGTNIASVNYVLGDRPVKKVKYSYDNGLKVEYTFENIDNVSTDLNKYVAYLMEHNKFLIDDTFDLSLENGKTKLYAQPTTLNEDKIIMELSWTKNSYSFVLYKQKSI